MEHRGQTACPLVQQTGWLESQRSAALRINRHEPLARMFSAAREAAYGQISTNQKQCHSEPLSLRAPSGSGPIQREQIPPGLEGQEDGQKQRGGEGGVQRAAGWKGRKKKGHRNVQKA